MKAKLILNNKEYEVEVSEEQVKEIEKPKYKRWRAEKGGKYYFLDGSCSVVYMVDYYIESDRKRYEVGNYFKTKEEAEFRRQQLLYLQQYRDFIGEDLPTGDDFKNEDVEKYYAYYDCTEDAIITAANCVLKSQGIIYSKDEEKIENFIKEIGENNFKKYILEVEE